MIIYAVYEGGYDGDDMFACYLHESDAKARVVKEINSAKLEWIKKHPNHELDELRYYLDGLKKEYYYKDIEVIGG